MRFMVSYVKARATALGVSCDIGWMERGHRTLFLIVWVMLICILPGYRNLILWSGLVLYLVLTSATALQRIIQTRSNLSP
jgi:phosphatidylglycerophosphate synthase